MRWCKGLVIALVLIGGCAVHKAAKPREVRMKRFLVTRTTMIVDTTVVTASSEDKVLETLEQRHHVVWTEADRSVEEMEVRPCGS
jgi:hypothetical protein